MAKVIISFLGTGGYVDNKSKSRGEYRPAKYNIDGKILETNFVSAALLDYYMADRIIYIGTVRSMWDVVYDTFVPNPSVEIWEQLSTQSNEWNHKTPLADASYINEVFEKTIITPMLVKYGINTEENEENIKVLFGLQKLLNDGDELYIDVSHGFRSLPLVLTNVINFIIENLKMNVSIKNISYGMFEVSSEMDGITPIVNLNIVQELQQTIKASHEFKEYGNAFLFSSLLADADKSLSTLLLDFSNTKSLNHIHNLKTIVVRLNGVKFDDLSSTQSVTIPVTLNSFLNRFKNSKQDSHYQYEIAKWNLDNHSYGYAALGLGESIISKVCEELGLSPDDELSRSIAKNVFSSKKNKKIKTDLSAFITQRKREELIPAVDLMLSKKEEYKTLVNVYNTINKIRNIVAHAISSKYNVRTMLDNLNSCVLEIKTYVYSTKI